MHASLSGSITMRPAASSSRMVLSERIIVAGRLQGTVGRGARRVTAPGSVGIVHLVGEPDSADVRLALAWLARAEGDVNRETSLYVRHRSFAANARSASLRRQATTLMMQAERLRLESKMLRLPSQRND